MEKVFFFPLASKNYQLKDQNLILSKENYTRIKRRNLQKATNFFEGIKRGKVLPRKFI